MSNANATWSSASSGTTRRVLAVYVWDDQDEAAKSRFACAARGCRNGASTGHVLTWVSRDPRVGYCPDHEQGNVWHICYPRPDDSDGLGFKGKGPQSECKHCDLTIHWDGKAIQA